MKAFQGGLYLSHQTVNFGQKMVIVEKRCYLLSMNFICSCKSQDNRSRRTVTVDNKLGKADEHA